MKDLYDTTPIDDMEYLDLEDMDPYQTIMYMNEDGTIEEKTVEELLDEEDENMN